MKLLQLKKKRQPAPVQPPPVVLGLADRCRIEGRDYFVVEYQITHDRLGRSVRVVLVDGSRAADSLPAVQLQRQLLDRAKPV